MEFNESQEFQVKSSLGIIICRKNPENNRIEVLLVHRRYTYAFADFVFGRYARGKGGIHTTLSNVTHLLKNMTKEEIFDVYSLNYEQMWYRIWLTTAENKDLLTKKQNKFNSAFMRDGGVALRAYIMKMHIMGYLRWEVPKGKKISPKETNIACAIREIKEETDLDKKSYRILPEITKKMSHVSNGVRYNCTYYVAISEYHQRVSPPLLRSLNLMAEVDESKWHDIEQIRALNIPPLSELVIPVLKYVKLYLKGKTKKTYIM